ncbi:dermonecrotic toxin domain-containing protein [Pseudomonas japonica]|uniref:dermonecrotic toxin domain-containing protein n=1 Tax=Pseudomonas japonica TaxID=256466 RepID=UPI0038136B3C
MSIDLTDGPGRLSLLELTRWELWIHRFFDGQPFFEMFAREQLMLHLRTYHPQGDVAPSFPEALLDALLQRLIDGQLPSFEEQPQGILSQLAGALPAETRVEQADERRQSILQTIEGVAPGVVGDYCESLQRQWQQRPAGLDGGSVIGEKFLARQEAHCAELKSLFRQETLNRFDSQTLRQHITDMEARWRASFEDGGGLPARERRQIDGLIRTALGDWFAGLSRDELDTLRDFQQHVALLREQVRLLLEDVESLYAHSRVEIIARARAVLGVELEPDELRVETRLNHSDYPASRTTRLAELVAEGPFEADPGKSRTLSRVQGALNQTLPDDFLDALLAQVDPRASYHRCLTDRYARTDVLAALYDLNDVCLQQSAFIALCKGHLSREGHDLVMRVRADNGVGRDEPGEKVTGVSQFPDEPLAQLMLFHGEDGSGQLSGLVLYAPGKPDGQEWIELPSLRALAAELGGWLRDEAGTRYLLDRLNVSGQAKAEAFYANVRERPELWDLRRDHRGLHYGYAECSRHLVELGRDNHLDQVAWYEAPRWLQELPMSKRRLIAGLNEDLRLLNEAMQQRVNEQESYLAFSRRTVQASLASYLKDCGVVGEVDPETILFDFVPGLDSSVKITRTLLDLAMYGHDDNWGLDNPRMPVRSSVGQDLSRVRAADLAIWLRGVFLGERYAESLRKEFLDASHPQYAPRRALHLRMARTTLLRDVHATHGKQMITVDERDWLLGVIEQLGEARPLQGDSADNIASSGVFRFTLNGRRSVGLYVFRRIVGDVAQDWLYTPQAPDGLTLRKYQSFVGSERGAMHDWYLQYLRFVDRPAVSQWLGQLAKGKASRDALREGNRISDFTAEYDEQLKNHISDIEEVTRSRYEVIVAQVTKGLLYAAFPLSLAFPPLGFLLDAVFIAIGSIKAIRSHMANDDAAALDHWLGVAATLWGIALPGAWGALAHASRAGVRKVSEVSRWNQVTQQARPGVRQGERALISVLDEQRALKTVPDNLRSMEKGGVWRGVFQRSDDSGQVAFYVRDRGRYFQVVHDREYQTLRLIDPRRPDAQYRVPIRLGPGNRWQFNGQVGLRGGAPTVYLGQVREVFDAFPARTNPLPERCVLQGEGLVAGFSPGITDNYLYSLNIESCVVACLYNPVTRCGAMIHIDHNIGRLIDEALDSALSGIRRGGEEGRISATLVGGDWLSSGADIGGPIRSALARRGIMADWDHWSYSSCFGNIYGVRLDLADGAASVFTSTRSSVQRVIDPILLDATRGGQSDLARRAMRFLQRFREDPLVQTGSGAVTTLGGKPASASQIRAQALLLTTLDR